MLGGKVAVVTGSTSGIGLGIARALAASGADIMLNGFGDPAAIEKTRSGIEGEFGVKAAYSAADISNPTDVDAMIVSADRDMGGVDILVNNAGIQHTSAVEQFERNEWDAIIAINLSSNFHAIRAVLPRMRQRNWGRIINIASVHGHVASINKAAYVAAKHGVIGLTKVVALETAKSGVTCNAICPGWVLTPLVQRQVDALAEREGVSVQEAKERLLVEKQPSAEFATPEQIGGLAVFLCSDAAAQIRGASMPVDGGWTAQ